MASTLRMKGRPNKESGARREDKRQIALVNIIIRKTQGNKDSGGFSVWEKISEDTEYVRNLHIKAFAEELTKGFSDYAFKSSKVRSIVLDFVSESKKREKEIEGRKVNVVIKMQKCPHCSEPHSGYNVKLDKDNKPYTTCRTSSKRIEVKFKNTPVTSNDLHSLQSMLFGTVVEVLSGEEEHIQRVKKLAENI